MFCTIESIKAILSTDYFEGHKLPPDNQLALQADVVADDIRGILSMYQYEMPEENTDFYRYLASINAIGVVAIVAKRIFPTQSMNKNEYEDRYNKSIQRLIDHSWASYYTQSITEDSRTW